MACEAGYAWMGRPASNVYARNVHPVLGALLVLLVLVVALVGVVLNREQVIARQAHTIHVQQTVIVERQVQRTPLLGSMPLLHQPGAMARGTGQSCINVT